MSILPSGACNLDDGQEAELSIRIHTGGDNRPRSRRRRHRSFMRVLHLGPGPAVREIREFRLRCLLLHVSRSGAGQARAALLERRSEFCGIFRLLKQGPVILGLPAFSRTCRLGTERRLCNCGRFFL